MVGAPYAEAPENALPFFNNQFVKPVFDRFPNPTAVIEGATEEEIRIYTSPKVPEYVTKRQLRQALILSSIPLESIAAAISQIQNQTEKSIMEIYWNVSYEFERYHPKLIEFSSSLGMSESQVDAIFILASTL